MALSNSNRRATVGVGVARTVLLGLVLAGAAFGQAIEESQFKAAFLFNVAKFVEWPPGTFKGPTDPIVACTLGDSPVNDALKQATSNTLIGARKFVVRHISKAEQSAGCNILFASSPERKRWPAIFEAVKGTTVLTIGNIEGFALDGGVANFKREGDRIRIQINLEAADQQKLQFSSRLLSLSLIVKEKAR